MSDLGSDVTQIVDGEFADDVRFPIRKAAVAGWLYATTSQIAAKVASLLFGSLTGQAGKVITVNGAEDGFEFTTGGGGGGSGGLYDISMGVPLLSAVEQVGTAGGRFTWTERAGIALNVKYNGTDSGTPDIAGFGVDAPPAGDFHIAALSLNNQRNGRYTGRIMGIRESSSGKMRLIGMFSAGHWAIMMASYSNTTTRVSNAESGQYYGLADGAVWMHLKRVGSNLSFGWSRDGANPIFYQTESQTTYCPTFDQIVIGGFFEHTDNMLDSSFTYLCYDDDAGSRVMGG